MAPAWPITYDELAPWYERAEALYRVHGRAGLDPQEAPRSGPYPHQPLPLDPLFEPLRQGLERQGSHPYDLPLSWSEVEEDPSGDAELFGVQPALEHSGARLISNARVTQLHVDPSGREVKGVEAEIDGQLWLFRGDQVVLAAGAVNTPALLLRSRSELHPDGLANGSGQVGRNLMKPQLTAILQLARETHSGRFPAASGSTTTSGATRTSAFRSAISKPVAGCCRTPSSQSRRLCSLW